VDNLNEIDIILAKYLRMLDPTKAGSKIACMEIVSDVLLQHREIVTRKWLSGVLTTLKSKGFTTLTVVNPKMHSPEEVEALRGLFDGEIKVTKRETAQGTKRTLRIEKLLNHECSEAELILPK